MTAVCFSPSSAAAMYTYIHDALLSIATYIVYVYVCCINLVYIVYVYVCCINLVYIVYVYSVCMLH